MKGACAHQSQPSCDCWPVEASPSVKRVSAFHSKKTAFRAWGGKHKTVRHKKAHLVPRQLTDERYVGGHRALLRQGSNLLPRTPVQTAGVSELAFEQVGPR